jgi:3-oxoacyl-[acyl-carrier-protein] synthase II
MGENRGGTLLGEGSACLVLEKREDAEKNRAEIMAEIEGYGTAFDAKTPQYQYDPEAKDAIRAIKLALQDANLEPKDINFVSSGLSGYPAGDEMELKAIRSVLGDDIPILAIKTLIGETYDAAGAFQMAAALFVIENNYFHPKYTINQPKAAAKYPARRGMITSFGFNGHNSVLIVKKGD